LKSSKREKDVRKEEGGKVSVIDNGEGRHCIEIADERRVKYGEWGTGKDC